MPSARSNPVRAIVLGVAACVTPAVSTEA